MSVIAGIGIVALLAAGCARGGDGGGGSSESAAASPGITDDSITLGITTPLSGADRRSRHLHGRRHHGVLRRRRTPTAA